MEEMIEFPKTFHGWKTLFWLSINRCPIHHSLLSIDATIYDQGGPGYCWNCDGVGIWPRSMMDALEQNYRHNHPPSKAQKDRADE